MVPLSEDYKQTSIQTDASAGQIVTNYRKAFFIHEFHLTIFQLGTI